jgi:hypothetical protein
MSTKTREVIWGGRVMGAKMRAEAARKDAKKAVRAADLAEAEAWSVRMEGWRASTTITDDRAMPNGGLGWVEVECNRLRRGQAWLADHRISAGAPNSVIRRGV